MKNIFGIVSCTCLFLLGIDGSFAQNGKTDSLTRCLAQAVQDTTRLKLLVALSEESEAEDILKYAKPACELADKLLLDRSLSNSHSLIKNKKALALGAIGFYYYNQSQIQEALEYYKKSLEMQEEIGDKTAISSLLNNMGFIYKSHGQIKEALDCYSRSLDIREKLGDKKAIATTLNNISVIFSSQGQTKEALAYYNRSMKLYEEMKDKKGVALALNNIGLIYKTEGKYGDALTYYNHSLEIRTETGDKRGIAESLNNIGMIWNAQGDPAKALEFYGKSLQLQKQIHNRQGTAYALKNIGAAWFKLAAADNSPNRKKKYALSLAYVDSSLILSKQNGYAENIRNAEQMLAKIDSARGNGGGAFEHYKQYIFYRDSISNQETRKAGLQKQMAYEYEKKEAVLKEQQEKDHALAEEKSRKQVYVLALVSFILLIVVVFAVLILRTLRTTRHQKEIIEEKQKEILDSIYYARRIQRALITSERYIEKKLRARGSPSQ